MSVGIKPIQDSIACVASCTSPSPLELLRAASMHASASGCVIYSVPTAAFLPSAASNKGRVVFVSDVSSYRYSDGTQWTNDFTSTQTTYPTAWSFGSNTSGQLGDNTTTNRSSPVSVVGGSVDWRSVSVGFGHVAAGLNGTIWTWGLNTSGQLGDGTTTASSSPVSVIGGFTDWCWVSAGYKFTSGVRSNGTLWTWGYNASGQLGDGTTSNKSSPVSVVGGFTDWCQVSAGLIHAVAIRKTGTLWAWGFNGQGRLGDGTSASKSSPVPVAGGFIDWCQANAGQFHTVGIRANGTLWAWGLNTNGELGDNTTTARSSPVSVVGGFTDWCRVSTGSSSSHTVAVRTNGTLWAWGCNTSGQLGDNTTVSKSSPVSVVGGFTNWCQVSAGGNHTVAIRTNGTLWAWGSGGSGELGNNANTNRSSPVSVVGGFTDWGQVSAGPSRTTAIRFGKGFPAA